MKLELFVRSVVMLVLAVTFCHTTYAGSPSSNEDAGVEAKTVDTQIKSYVGSDAALNNNLMNPLISSSKMSTFDGQQFDAQLTCEGEKETLGMVVVPGATGDIDNLFISQDTTNNGIMNSSVTLPFNISGVCANGVVSCTPGTWSSCQSYKWGVAGDGKLELNKVGIKKVGGCYCINNHCGSNLVLTNMNNILGDLASGAMAAITEKNMQYVPSRLKIDGNSGIYYTQQMIDCGSSAATPEAAYYDSPSTISPTAFSSSGSDDTYDLLTNSVAAEESTSAVKACSIKREISLTLDYNDVPSCEVGTWAYITKTSATFDKRGDDAWLETQVYCDPTGPLKIRVRAWDGGGKSSCNSEMGADSEGFVTLTMPSDDKVSSGYVFTTPNLKGSSCYDVPVFYNGSCVSKDGGCTYNFDFYNGSQEIDIDTWTVLYREYPESCATNIASNTKITTSNCVDLPGGGSVVYKNKGTISTTFIRPHITPTPDFSSCRLDTESITNTCTLLESDVDCSLLKEAIDTVKTVENYQPTGVYPLASTVSISDGLCTKNFTRDYWGKDREYRCKTSITTNYDDIITRAGTVMSSSDSSTGTYSDMQLNTGGWKSTSGAIIQIPDAIDPTSCVNACKTRTPRTNTDAGTYGINSDLRVTDITYDYEYKECIDNTCPLETGEQLVKECGCLNEFGEAAATIQAVRLGSRDLICTSGNPQQP